MKTYKVTSVYDGKGEVIMEAKNEEEAKEMFLCGEWEQKDVDDTSDGYEVLEVNKV